MNYKVKDLLDNRNIVSHLFLDCIDKEMADEITSAEDYDINTTEVDIRLVINGREINISNFLNHLEEDYFKLVKRTADNLVRESLSNRVDEISGMLDSLKDKLEHIENNIEWDEKLIKDELQ
jgi:Mg2+ and Co2+ transporter CorA